MCVWGGGGVTVCALFYARGICILMCYCQCEYHSVLGAKKGVHMCAYMNVVCLLGLGKCVNWSAITSVNTMQLLMCKISSTCVITVMLSLKSTHE